MGGKLEEIATDELYKLMQSEEDVVLVNVLKRATFKEAFIPKSINIPYNPPDSFVERFGTVVPDIDRQIVVYCWGPQCETAGKAGRMLLKEGYTNVLEYKGGLQEWRKSSYKLLGTDLKLLDVDDVCKE